MRGTGRRAVCSRMVRREAGREMGGQGFVAFVLTCKHVVDDRAAWVEPFFLSSLNLLSLPSLPKT